MTTAGVTTTVAALSAAKVDIENAGTLRVVGGLDGSTWVAWTEGTQLKVAALDPVANSLGEPIEVSGAEGVINHPLERPALAITAEGLVYVAWITGEGNVRLASIEDGVVSSSEVISGEARPETALVQMIATSDGHPVVSWLEDSTLSVALGEPSLVEHELVDDLTCDCCHPVPIQIDTGVGVGYRDLERRSDGVVRDIAFISGSRGGDSFAPSVVVADEPWYLDACPLSGPTLARRDDDLLISWMDARQVLHPDQSSSSIWFDTSSDGGKTFGMDMRLTEDEATYRSPAMAVDPAGTIHLVWERRTPDAATLQYTRSEDAGATFAQADTLVEGDEQSGAPREVALVATAGQRIVSWIDSDGGHVGIWPSA